MSIRKIGERRKGFVPVIIAIIVIVIIVLVAYAASQGTIGTTATSSTFIGATFYVPATGTGSPSNYNLQPVPTGSGSATPVNDLSGCSASYSCGQGQIQLSFHPAATSISGSYCTVNISAPPRIVASQCLNTAAPLQFSSAQVSSGISYYDSQLLTLPRFQGQSSQGIQATISYTLNGQTYTSTYNIY